jgi:hypothetical protein
VLELFRVRGRDVARQDLAELRENPLVRRHFEDLFEHPQVSRTALPDTVIAGARVGRERVVLTESRDQRVPMGRRTLVHHTLAQSVAEISTSVPLFHLLSAVTRTEVDTTSDPPDARRRPPPPIITELTLRCLEFGHDASDKLPKEIAAQRAHHN